MASWVTQTFDLKLSETQVTLDSDGVQILYAKYGNHDWIYFDPKTREEANQMAIVLKLASQHLEKVGKDLP